VKRGLSFYFHLPFLLLTFFLFSFFFFSPKLGMIVNGFALINKQGLRCIQALPRAR
jgi:hypothetical protein